MILKYINRKMKRIFLFLFFATSLTANSQVGIGTTSPDPSAKLDVTSTNKGFLPPRVSLTSITDITTISNSFNSTSPAVGLLIYNTSTTQTGSNDVIPGYYFWNGFTWSLIVSIGSSGILPVANGGTNSSSLPLNNVIIGNGSSSLKFVAPGVSGNLLTSDGNSWQSLPSNFGQIDNTTRRLLNYIYLKN